LGGGSVQRQGLYLHRTTQTHIHAPSRIRNWDPNVRATEDSTCLRPRGYWDRPLECHVTKNSQVRLVWYFTTKANGIHSYDNMTKDWNIKWECCSTPRRLGPLACSDSELTSENANYWLLGRGSANRKASNYNMGQHSKGKIGQTSMPRTGYEPTIPVLKLSECSKTICTLDRVANGIGVKWEYTDTSLALDWITTFERQPGVRLHVHIFPLPTGVRNVMKRCPKELVTSDIIVHTFEMALPFQLGTSEHCFIPNRRHSVRATQE
jgi:hypothetical protein